MAAHDVEPSMEAVQMGRNLDTAIDFDGGEALKERVKSDIHQTDGRAG